MPNAVTDIETLSDLIVPSDIGKLMQVDKEHKPTENTRERSSEDLPEEERKSNYVKKLGVVHQTSENIRPIPGEETNGL